MAKGGNLPAGHGHRADIEEPDIRQWPTVELLYDLLCFRALDLKPVMTSSHRLVTGTGRRPIIAFQLDVPVAGLGVKLGPIDAWNSSDHVELVLLRAKQDHVADHVTSVAARNEMLGLGGREALEAVDGEIGEQALGIGPFHGQLGHVVRLVVEDSALPPSSLFVSPVGELGSHHRIDIGADLGVA